MSQRDDGLASDGLTQNHILGSASTPLGPATPIWEKPLPLSFDDVADEIGGLPEEIRGWVESNAMELVDRRSALDGRVCEEDVKRIEKHQIAVDIRRCFENPEAFLDTKFERLGDKTPRQLLESDDAGLVRDLVWLVKSGAS